MARGAKPGERRGGRRKGAQNKATKTRLEIVATASAGGITPLELMLSTMRSFWSGATDKTGRIVNEERAELAAKWAEKAAPFVHPKLTSVEASIDGPASHEDALAELE